MSRPPAINADGRFVFATSLRKPPGDCNQGASIALVAELVVRHRDCLKTSVAGRLMTAVPNDVGQISKILSSCVGWAKRQRAHHPRRARDGGHGASAPLSTLRNSVWGSLAKTIYHSDFNLIWVVQSLREKYFAFLSGKSVLPARPVLSRQEGRFAVVTNAGWDAVDAAALARRGGRRARLNS